LGCNIIHPQKKGRLSLLRLRYEGLLQKGPLNAVENLGY
jgi:hypothetical protein